MKKAARYAVAIGHIITPPTSAFVDSIRTVIKAHLPHSEPIVYPEEKHLVQEGFDMPELLRTTFRMTESAFERYADIDMAAALYPSLVVMERAKNPDVAVGIILCSLRSRSGRRCTYLYFTERTAVSRNFLEQFSQAVAHVVGEFGDTVDVNEDEKATTDQLFDILTEGFEFVLESPEEGQKVH